MFQAKGLFLTIFTQSAIQYRQIFIEAPNVAGHTIRQELHPIPHDEKAILFTPVSPVSS